jgi:hypothetical protein
MGVGLWSATVDGFAVAPSWLLRHDAFVPMSTTNIAKNATTVNLDIRSGYTSSQTVGSVFSVPYASLANATLAEGLAFQGGDTVEEKSEILLRAAIAAVLNAAHPSINYPLSVSGIVSTVNAALASGDSGTIVALAGALDSRNNLGCSINGK